MVWLIIAAVAAASPTAANNDPQIQTQISLCAFVFSKEGSRNSSCCSLPFRNCHLNQPFVVLILLFCYYFWQVQLWFWPLMLIIHYFFMRSLWHQWCNSIGAVSCCWYRMTSCLCGRSYVSTQVNWFKHVNAVVKHVCVVHFWPCCTFSARIHFFKSKWKVSGAWWLWVCQSASANNCRTFLTKYRVRAVSQQKGGCFWECLHLCGIWE